jgi:glutaredoxin 3
MNPVKIYSTPSCVYCKMAKAFFKEHNVQFQDFDVQNDLKAREEMFSISHQMGVPVIDVNGEVYVGFDRGALAKALNIS